MYVNLIESLIGILNFKKSLQTQIIDNKNISSEILRFHLDTVDLLRHGRLWTSLCEENMVFMNHIPNIKIECIIHYEFYYIHISFCFIKITI